MELMTTFFIVLSLIVEIGIKITVFQCFISHLDDIEFQIPLKLPNLECELEQDASFFIVI